MYLCAGVDESRQQRTVMETPKARALRVSFFRAGQQLVVGSSPTWSDIDACSVVTCDHAHAARTAPLVELHVALVPEEKKKGGGGTSANHMRARDQSLY
jgi:hypothetical protein